jgi:cell division protein FtsQ
LKKLNYKKILITVLWIIAIAGLTSSWAFVSKSERNIVAKTLTISIHNNDENLFLSEKDITQFFIERKDSILLNQYKNINIPELEKSLNSHPAIENAEVAANINGEIKIDITQRTPVLRVINRDGESYYIDSQTKLMPLNQNYSARVIVASGFKEVSLLDDVYDVANFINRDSVLVNLIHQIYVNEEKEIELFPAIGDQKIVFGNATDVAEKFNKLKLFYTEGLNKSDSWTKYSNINLKYKNLVVCTKK